MPGAIQNVSNRVHKNGGRNTELPPVLLEIDLTGIKHGIDDLQAAVGKPLDVDSSLLLFFAEREALKFGLKDRRVDDAAEMGFGVTKFLSDLALAFRGEEEEGKDLPVLGVKF